MKNQIASFLLAIQFLTRLPVPGWFTYSEARMTASAAYYPLVGVMVGALCSAVFWSVSLLFPPLVSVLIANTASLLLTGAFHEDGLADTFDGIGGGHTRDAALEIMRDSRLGTYGTAALVAALALKTATLTALPAHMLLFAFPAAHGLSRLSSVLTIATSRYVRTAGTGKPVAQGLSLPSLLIASVTGVAICLAWIYLLPAAPLLFGLIGLATGHVAMRAFFEFKLKGYTGDTLGAVQQVSEIGFYLGLLAWL
ncbi:MAG: adenosylcobinamide-GDP ribazoletransferase [Hyphomonas oceanitis]|uniref:adenosylcobinamide-GDP ribazoletransferase n=1 Tax=Hyphomonas oceanitis TaxID=81033 RepID=UPI003002D5EE